jgi:hypothetical protein
MLFYRKSETLSPVYDLTWAPPLMPVVDTGSFLAAGTEQQTAPTPAVKPSQPDQLQLWPESAVLRYDFNVLSTFQVRTPCPHSMHVARDLNVLFELCALSTRTSAPT